MLGKDNGFVKRYLTDTFFVLAVNLLGGLDKLGDLTLREIVIDYTSIFVYNILTLNFV